MAKLDGNKRLSRDAMPNSQDWIDPFLINQNQVNDSVVNAIRGNLNHQDNTTSGYFTGNFTHGVERIIRNPLIKSGTNGPSPIGVQAVNCQKLYTDASSLSTPAVASVSLRYVNGNDPAAAEQVGITVKYSDPSPFERLSEFIPPASNVSLVTTVSKNFNGITLTPGSWDVTLVASFTVSVAASDVRFAISTVSNTLPAAATQPDQYFDIIGPVSSAQDVQSSIPNYRVDITSSTTYFGVARATFAAGTCGVYGRISAIRAGIDPATTATVTLFFHGG